MNSIEQDIIDRAGKQLADDIDKQILKDLGGPEFQLVYDTGTVLGQTYYTIQPLGWAWTFDNIEWHHMVAWCVETFGPTSKDGVWTPDQRWYVNNAKFWFKEAKDRDWFTLRWS
jgi:hypothetical protein